MGTFWKGYRGAMAAMIAAIALVGCGGGGGGGSTSGNSEPPPVSTVTSAVAWAPPATYSDNTTLDPTLDLNFYEIYMRSDVAFSEQDQPVALVSASYDDTTLGGVAVKKATTEFALAALLPYVPEGPVCYISIRAVGIDGQKSGFMAPVSWDKT